MSASSRDPQLIALHRGGTLTVQDHRLLVAWAATCAARVLPLFRGEHPLDPRPLTAIDVARQWSEGLATTGEARQAAIDAHAAAREAEGAATLAARAAGHAVATAHMADHELGAAYYAIKAFEASGASATDLDAERRWQLDALPPSIADLVRSDMHRRAAKFQGTFTP